MSPPIHDGLGLDDDYMAGLADRLDGVRVTPAGPPEGTRQAARKAARHIDGYCKEGWHRLCATERPPRQPCQCECHDKPTTETQP